MEIEDNNKSLAFLDTRNTNNGTGNYDIDIYRKDAITNVQLKPNSSINPKMIDGVFKGFLARAWRICSTAHRDDEIQFLIDIFVDNGHSRDNLKKIADSYRPPEFRSSNENQATDRNLQMVKLPWVPGLGPKLKKIYKSKGFSTIFSSSANLKSLLCNNKDSLLPNSCPGVYRLD